MFAVSDSESDGGGEPAEAERLAERVEAEQVEPSASVTLLQLSRSRPAVVRDFDGLLRAAQIRELQTSRLQTNSTDCSFCAFLATL